MGKLVLYGVDASPPVRACKLTLAALGLQYEYKLVKLLDGEHRTAEFERKNPQHTVPVLEDDGQYIWDSHAIIAYLVRRYAKDDSLYPKDFLKRAVVDQRLHFESGVLFQGCLRNIALPVFYDNESDVPRAKIDAIYEAYDFLEAFLGDEPYMCGKTITLADFSIVSTVSSFEELAPIDAAKNPKLKAWLARISQLSYYNQANGYGAKMLIDMFKEKIKRIV
ncbi:glutathione S-transferase 1-like [Rhagoletis pomonella]|uniref:glutathione S-transferase 1-like n=1 Tax=Rhagoletis pomonella TaxID=28610 RepID=UPI0017861C10|nr:glutathione S-transferase 1-like [Rhagoletis pomonella]